MAKNQRKTPKIDVKPSPSACKNEISITFDPAK
jgi:hypothetical protein